MENSQRVTRAAAVLALGAVMLAGCGSDPDQPTDATTTSSSASSTTPTSKSSTTPADPAGANAIKVVKNFEKTMNDLRLDPSLETGELGAYATGDAYRQRTFSIRQSREAGESHKGRITVVEAKATPQSTLSQRVVACTDVSARRSRDNEGKVIPAPYKRLERVYTVKKSAGAKQDGKWRVTAEEATRTC